MLTASGALVAISTLKPGDQVLATSTKTGKTQAEPVAAVLARYDQDRYDQDRYDLKVRAAGHTTVIKTTRSHLFWNQTTHRWTKAAALKYGTHLRTPSDGSVTVLGGWTPKVTTGWMWDLTIPGNNDHDFYIRAAASTVLVHNVDGQPCEGAGRADINWVDEGGDLRSTGPAMRSNAYDYQSAASGARSNAITGRSMAPQLEMPGADGSTVTARFDGIDENEIIDRS